MYLNNRQIHEMARAAFNTYEMTADWRSALRAAHEYATDEIGVRPNRTAVLLAVKIAKTQWVAASQSVARTIAHQL